MSINEVPVHLVAGTITKTLMELGKILKERFPEGGPHESWVNAVGSLIVLTAETNIEFEKALLKERESHTQEEQSVEN